MVPISLFTPYIGQHVVIKAFVVVVIGGMGSIMGTLLGGLILGLAQLIGAEIFGVTYELLIGYIVMLIILAIRPQGLLSKKTSR